MPCYRVKSVIEHLDGCREFPRLSIGWFVGTTLLAFHYPILLKLQVVCSGQHFVILCLCRDRKSTWYYGHESLSSSKVQFVRAETDVLV
ncbi:hypothetical protein RHMOL_Rhmol08G0095100 [Rhododendron molle]|uniref:Uncharacterized protein n=1 Tax=Rhododendron molle TaxID=49168 RepID=A0ACC0MMN2_RHOML|nr:hypothetical protein RHMOL_Rhmol08G0095100 [Rhododendron molle]